MADAVTAHALNSRFPTRMEFKGEQGQPIAGLVNYTFDETVHDDMADVYLRYQPDYACFVAIDVETGAILNITSFIKADEKWDNLVMRSDYPAASVFKMVTAAAGLDLGKVTPSSVIPFNGKSTTLYKKQVLSHEKTKWTRSPTFKESFAKSVNPVFGRLGVKQIGADNLRLYAHKFGFGEALQSDFHLPPSTLGLAMEDEWEVAEAASGYTRDITLSPIHAAQIAAIVANDGKMVTPYMVDSVVSNDGHVLYRAQHQNSSTPVITEKTAASLRSLMTETTRIGSARKSFRGLDRYKVYNNMEIGGKTGSLTGLSPRGRHDWFVGYAEKDGRRVAYASLIVNKEKWYVRSAYVARQFIYHYFTERMQDDVEMASAAAAE
ncbi:penicillin binding protein [Arenicella xantha]|uniref:Penicillin binding protein n=1 Tax=Arenicella xantha TaxID=644221 RepID=A0A395JI89_9GAMM|nr:penicillin binding protein [Arenicella xantha]